MKNWQKWLLAAFILFLILPLFYTLVLPVVAPEYSAQLGKQQALKEQTERLARQAQKDDRKRNREVIWDARLYKWANLPVNVRGQVGDFHLYYPLDDWQHGERFERGEAYYVRAIINHKRLAKLSESDAFPAERTLTEKPVSLYGKYKNRWHLLDYTNDEIPNTSKFDGFNTIDVRRSEQADTVWIGPIPTQPDRLVIELKGNNTKFKPSAKIHTVSK